MGIYYTTYMTNITGMLLLCDVCMSKYKCNIADRPIEYDLPME